MDTLYKYVSANRALTCIPEVGDGTLRATQPAALNDPFECHVHPLYNFPDKAKENHELAKVLTGINQNRRITEEYVDCARSQHGRLFTRQLIAEQISTRFGIVSFSECPFHPLMWSHYAADGSGFVIGYNVTELRNLAASEEHLQKVIYAESPPPNIAPNVRFSEESSLLRFLYVKSNHWSYENEWRLIVELNRTIGRGESDERHNQPINLLRIPNEAVVSVFYTERTPCQAVKLICDRLADPNNRYRARKSRRLVLSFTSYGYEEEPDD